MNTHDKIELPPLVGTLGMLPEHHRKVVEAYGRACARSAIEADRQRGGEPVAWADFAGYLIDNFEGHEITEERMQLALAGMLEVALQPQQQAGEPVLGPFTLDVESYEPGFRDINRPGHPGFMRVVWKMEDDERSPECEKVAHFVIDALNAADGQAGGEPTDSAGYTLGPVSDGGFDPRDRGEPVREVSDLVSRLRDADRPLLQQGKFSDVRNLLREAADFIASYGAAQPAASAEPTKGEPNWPWRVGLFWSSWCPEMQVRVLADGPADIERMEKHKSFIKWIYTIPVAAQPSVPVDIRQEVIETLEMILAADWRKWEELASPDEFVRRAKSRANYALSIINEAPQPAEPVKKRKAFICPNCEGVYADQPVSQCDCMPEKDEFIEGTITYPSPAAPQPQQIPNGWKDAVDHDLVTLGSTADSYASPEQAIQDLLDCQTIDSLCQHVTLQSALDAIDHVEAHNGPGRADQARALLVDGRTALEEAPKRKPSTTLRA